MWSQIAVSIKNGDVYMYLMIFIAWLGFIVIIERLVMLQFVFNLDFKKFVFSFKKLVQAEDIDRALSLCKKASKTSLPMISLRALEAAESDPTTVRGVIEEETLDFLPRLENRLQLLPALSTIVLLVGVLGTIDQLWQAFHSIDILDTAEKQASMAGGIAAALSHAALGLLLCTVFVCGHHVLRSIAVKLTERVQYGVAVLTNLLAPPETGGFVPAMMPMAAPMAQAQSESHQPAMVEEKQPEEEAFNDAAIEDIKDEEEII